MCFLSFFFRSFNCVYFVLIVSGWVISSWDSSNDPQSRGFGFPDCIRKAVPSQRSELVATSHQLITEVM